MSQSTGQISLYNWSTLALSRLAAFKHVTNPVDVLKYACSATNSTKELDIVFRCGKEKDDEV